MLDFILKILGLVSPGAAAATGAVVNNASGILNHVVFIPLLTYLIGHSDQQIRMDTSLGFLAVIVGGAYVLLEMQRRSRPA